MENAIEIPLSKLKITLLFLGALGFVLLGVHFLICPDEWVSSKSSSSIFIKLLGIISILFFGTCGFFIAKKLFDTTVGLRIDDKGITDNSNAVSVGLIEWDDITGIQSLEIASSKMLLIKIKNPEKYINRATNLLSKKAMKANNSMYGSPISIISNSLKIKFSKLEELILSELEKRGNITRL